MKALVELHKRLCDLRMNHTIPLGRKDNTLSIRENACKSINQLVAQPSFWLRDVVKTVSTSSLKKQHQLPQLLVEVLDESEHLKVAWPDRDVAGMHAVIQRYVHVTATGTLVRYFSLLCRTKDHNTLHTLATHMCDSGVIDHFLAPDLLRIGVAMRTLEAQRTPIFQKVAEKVIHRAHIIIHTFSTKQLILFMHYGGDILPKCDTWKEFLTFYVAHHLESSTEEDLMRLIYFTARCVSRTDAKTQPLEKIIHRLIDASKSPTMTHRQSSKHIHVGTKGIMSFEARSSPPTKPLILAAVDTVVALSSSRELQAFFYQSTEFSKYVSQYLIPLCLNLWQRPSSTEERPAKPWITPSPVQAAALCRFFALLFSRSKMLPSGFHKQEMWWRKYVKDFLERSVFPELPPNHRAVLSIKEELSM